MRRYLGRKPVFARTQEQVDFVIIIDTPSKKIWQGIFFKLFQSPHTLSKNSCLIHLQDRFHQLLEEISNQ